MVHHGILVRIYIDHTLSSPSLELLKITDYHDPSISNHNADVQISTLSHQVVIELHIIHSREVSLDYASLYQWILVLDLLFNSL